MSVIKYIKLILACWNFLLLWSKLHIIFMNLNPLHSHYISIDHISERERHICLICCWIEHIVMPLDQCRILFNNSSCLSNKCRQAHKYFQKICKICLVIHNWGFFNNLNFYNCLLLKFWIQIFLNLFKIIDFKFIFLIFFWNFNIKIWEKLMDMGHDAVSFIINSIHSKNSTFFIFIWKIFY